MPICFKVFNNFLLNEVDIQMINCFVKKNAAENILNSYIRQDINLRLFNTFAPTKDKRP